MIRPPQEQIYARLRIARDYARVNQELHDDKVWQWTARSMLGAPSAGVPCEDQMILADEPAYELPPIARALKFDDFDRLCVRLVNDSHRSDGGNSGDAGSTPVACGPGPSGQPKPGRETNPAPPPVNVPSGAVYGGAGCGDYWADGSTNPSGYHGEIELTPVGAVPVVELEG